MMMLKEVEGRWHEEFGGTLPAEALAGSGVELPGDVIEFGLRVRRRIARALDQIAFPVSGQHPCVDLRRAIMDARHVGDDSPTVFATSAWAAAFARLAQTGDQLRAQCAARHGIECRVDGFVAHPQSGIVGVHASQYARDLLGRIPLAQQTCDVRPQRAVVRQARRTACRARQCLRPLLCQRCAIPTRQRWTAAVLWRGGRIAPAVARQLTTDRTWRALYPAGNCPQRTALPKTQLDHGAFFTAQVLVVRSHRNTLPPGKCCTSDLRPTLLYSPRGACYSDKALPPTAV